MWGTREGLDALLAFRVGAGRAHSVGALGGRGWGEEEESEGEEGGEEDEGEGYLAEESGKEGRRRLVAGDHGVVGCRGVVG